jgi:hypothetical protein
LFAIATNGTANTDATWLIIVRWRHRLYYAFRYCHCVTRFQDRYKSFAELQNSFPFTAATTQHVNTHDFGVHIFPQ